MRESMQALQRYTYLQGEIDGVYHEIALKMGLSDSAMIILYTLYTHENACPLQTICQRSGLAKQTINSALRKLEADGTLYLAPDGARSKRVCLTEAGQRLAERTVCRLMAAENDIFAAWPQADAEKYLALSEKYLSALREKLLTDF